MSKSNSNGDQDSQYPFLPQQQQQQQPQTSHSTTPSLHNQPLPEEAPPSYDAVIAKDIPQLHDNYDHLRGPPGQRGRDIKDRIPSESIARFQSEQGGSSSSAGPSISSSVAAAAAAGSHGASSPYEPHYGATRVIAHSPTSAQAPPLGGLTGQIALGSESDEEFAQDIDRLLGQDGETTSFDDDPSERSCWTIVGDQNAWIALLFMLVVLLPWTIFCFAWVLTFGLVAMILMIIPPIGYLFTVFAVFSIRALARVDLVLSSLLVSDAIIAKYPYIASQVFIAPEPGPAWQQPSLFGYTLPLPTFIRNRLESRHAARNRRPKNLWHRGANHLKTILDGHSTKGFFYFVLWKMMFAIPIFVVTVTLFALNVPFMVCFLPSLLNITKAFANWQYRWAVTWLTGKPSPIIL
ncbi:hypothetical protein BGZ97_000601 [Linnemannia gamsii]|uniref:Transmembrane protein n=1 Tax=Linnemannia gamsii TaxID=64522 RepID=A0A9P6RJN5_9FUNG|nr:hypothetical protein BGZ97_000601 [Linnemannia gamsii]